MARRKPTVISTSPSRYDTDVAVTTSIRATFDIDLDARYMDDFVYLLDSLGNRIDGRVSYKKKVITFTPKQSLSMGETYQFFIIGDSDLTDDKKQGVRSIIGDCMEGNVSINFTTEADQSVEPPVMTHPTNQSILRESPTFTWEAVDGVDGYQLQISVSNQFSSLVYPTSDDVDTLYDTTFHPDITFEDGLYYFRVRSVREDNVAGEWSKTYQFRLDTHEEGKISEGDADFVDATDDELFGVSMDLELVEEFPKPDSINVPTNVKSIYFRVIGDINLPNIDEDSVKIIGHHVSDDWEEESHGEVKGQVTIVRSNDGTTYIVFTPIELVDRIEGDS